MIQRLPARRALYKQVRWQLGGVPGGPQAGDAAAASAGASRAAAPPHSHGPPSISDEGKNLIDSLANWSWKS